MKTEPLEQSQISGLAAAEHSTGAEHSNLVLLEYGDYECPSCRAAEPVTQHLVNTFGSQLKFIYRHFPLIKIHPHAQLAAEAAEAAAAQGKFWEMHHLLCTHNKHLDLSALTGYAMQLELDMRRFNAEMTDHIYLQRVHEHRHAGEELGLQKTPGFFLNDVLIDVSSGLEHLEKTVRNALVK